MSAGPEELTQLRGQGDRALVRGRRLFGHDSEVRPRPGDPDHSVDRAIGVGASSNRAGTPGAPDAVPG